MNAGRDANDGCRNVDFCWPKKKIWRKTQKHHWTWQIEILEARVDFLVH